MKEMQESIKKFFLKWTPNEIKYNTIYVVFWGVGLFLSTYSFLFRSGEGVWAEFQDIFTQENIINEYVYPMILIMLLFHWDTIHASWRDTKNVMFIPVVLSVVSAFFICFIISLIDCLACRLLGFVLAWLSLITLKGYTVFCFPKEVSGTIPDDKGF